MFERDDNMKAIYILSKAHAKLAEKTNKTIYYNNVYYDM